MKTLIPVMLALALTLGLALPGLAQVVTITSTAPVEEPTQEGITAAFDQAVDLAVRHAITLGLRPLEVDDATLGPDGLTVRLLASDDADEPGREAASVPPRPGPPPQQAARVI